MRKKKDLFSQNVPGPGMYRLIGDFDFKDNNSSEEYQVGKVPKFSFGMKNGVKVKNLDMPGPGEYNVDQYPMNQKNIAHWIGTDVRRDLAVPYAGMYPGPGSYEVIDVVKPPAVS